MRNWEFPLTHPESPQVKQIHPPTESAPGEMRATKRAVPDDFGTRNHDVRSAPGPKYRQGGHSSEVRPEKSALVSRDHS